MVEVNRVIIIEKKMTLKGIIRKMTIVLNDQKAKTHSIYQNHKKAYITQRTKASTKISKISREKSLRNKRKWKRRWEGIITPSHPKNILSNLKVEFLFLNN